MRDVADTQGNGRGPGRQGRPDPGGPWEREPVGALPLTVGSLFAGIGGFDLGLERAGMRTLWFCEQDPFCRLVLDEWWPRVPCHPDVRALVADTDGSNRWGRPESGRVSAPAGTPGGKGGGGGVPVPVPPVDVLCGGFPCQDISVAGRGAGLAGERSGLWREFARLIGELRPRYVLVENVPALTSRGLDVVLADLAACGFDAEWDHLPASAFGAPHRRDRIWLVAYPGGEGRREVARGAHGDEAADAGRPEADDHIVVRVGPQRLPAGGRNGDAAHADSEPPGRPAIARPQRGQWELEPDVGRVAHGIPARVDRLRSLGNALVPQIAEWIGRQIIEWEALT